MLLVPLAHAFAPPPYDPAAVVVTVPPKLRVATIQAETAARRTVHPVVVVVAGKVADGRIEPGHESETEDAIEAVWEAWVLDPRFDATHTSLALLALDEREVRLRAGTAWDARYGFGPGAVGDVIDDAFLPLARAGDLDGGLAALVRELDDRIVAAERREWTLQWTGRGLAALGVASVPLGGLGALGLATSRARRAFREALATRRALVANAGARLDDLGLSYELRDRIVALKLKGLRTVALCAEVLAALDRLRVGVAALGARLDAVERDAAGVGPGPWRQALAALDAPFPYDTGAIASGLFDPPTQDVTVDPRAFADSLEADWARASAGWDRVLDAVDASLRSARADLVADDLAELRGTLASHGLPGAWVARHPLAADPEAAWEALDQVRLADPVAYLEALEGALAVDDALEAEVAELLALREAVGRARAEAAGVDLSGVDHHPTDPGDDVDRLRAEADRAEAAFVRTLAEATGIEAARAAGEAAIEGAEAARDLARRVADAAATGEATLARAEEELAGLDPQVAAATREIDALAPLHGAGVLDPARAELAASVVDAHEARRELAAARGAWGGRDLLRAVRLAEAALEERREALENLRQTREVLNAAEQAREDASRLWAALDATRAGYAATLAGLGVDGAGALLDGDSVLTELRSTWDTPGDWHVRRTALKAVVAAWASATGARVQADRELRERQRLDRERRQRESARAAARAMSSSVSRSRSSGSAYRAPSISSRSSSRPSSSRSAGRSFGSSGWSAGRKF